MKKCAACGKEYEATYDACPHCARNMKAVVIGVGAVCLAAGWWVFLTITHMV